MQQPIAACLAQIEDAERALAAARLSLKTLASGAGGKEKAPLKAPVAPAAPAFFMPDQAVVDALDVKYTDSPTSALGRQTSGMAMRIAIEPQPSKNPDQGTGEASYSWQRCGGCCCCICVPMIDPEHKKLVAWSLLSFVFIIYLVFFTPFTVAFDVEPEEGGPMWFLNHIINVYFILDVPLNFLICYRNHHGEVVRKPGKVARRYLGTWFALDLLTAIPWDQLPFTDGDAMEMTKSVRVLKIARILRTLRLIRVLKAGSIMDRVAILAEADPTLMLTLGLCKIILALLSMTHWAACGWYLTGTLMPGQSWVDAKLADLTDKGVHYMYSVYFTLTTMTTVGYGDITPQNQHEVAYASGLLLIAALVFAGLLTSLTDVVGTVSAANTEINDKKRKLGLYGRYRELPFWLVTSMRKHLMWMWETQGGFDEYEESLKMSLPPVLRRELCHHIYGVALKNLYSAPFLTWIHNYDLVFKDLATMVHSFWLTENDLVFRIDEPNDRIYILSSGVVQLSVNDRLHDDQGNDESPVNGAAKPQGTRKGAAEARLAVGVSMFPGAPAVPTPAAMHSAKKRLEAHDRLKYTAAVRIQTRYRKKLARLQPGEVSDFQPDKKITAAHMRSTLVDAPAYFGEACLWYPIETWEESPPPLFQYSARCQTRAEIVVIPRAMIHELIRRNSPWLLERFMLYRNAVVERLASLGVGGAQRPAVPSVTPMDALLPFHDGDAGMPARDFTDARLSEDPTPRQPTLTSIPSWLGEMAGHQTSSPSAANRAMDRGSDTACAHAEYVERIRQFAQPLLGGDHRARHDTRLITL